MRTLNRLKDYAGEHGLRYTLIRSSEKLNQVLLGSWDRVWKKEFPSEEELRRQRENPPAAGKISVVIPVYNTRGKFLRELLDCLVAQSYENWEAILFDGLSTREETLEILKNPGDPRFRVIRGEKNEGISGNTNAALKYAEGDYIALCDHDDILRPDALFRMAEAILREDPDWLYSDEDMMTENGHRHMDPHRKPDFCPEYLSNDNYVNHLTVFRKGLIEKAGGLRPAFDGSQDLDLYLRVAALTRKVTHVPYILYSWRKVRSSESRQHLDKCLDALARAAEDEAARRGEKLVAVPWGKRVRLWYDFPGDASVEAVIFSRSEAVCRDCFRDLEAAAPWPKLALRCVAAEMEDLYGALNRAAEESGADYLLFLDAATMVLTRHFFRELLMYAKRDGVAGVIPALIDEKSRLTHAGYTLGGEKIASPRNPGLYLTAGGWHDLMNKVHNISAVSPCCMMVRRDQFVPFDPRYQSGLGAAEEGLRATEAGKRFVYTPRASVYCVEKDLLLRTEERFQPDVDLFLRDHGKEIHDPCRSGGIHME